MHRHTLCALGQAAQERQRPAVPELAAGVFGDEGEGQERRAVDVPGKQDAVFPSAAAIAFAAPAPLGVPAGCGILAGALGLGLFGELPLPPELVRV